MKGKSMQNLQGGHISPPKNGKSETFKAKKVKTTASDKKPRKNSGKGYGQS
jgi:hypothetical protein